VAIIGGILGLVMVRRRDWVHAPGAEPEPVAA
jgi:hypothetical protein